MDKKTRCSTAQVFTFLAKEHYMASLIGLATVFAVLCICSIITGYRLLSSNYGASAIDECLALLILLACTYGGGCLHGCLDREKKALNH